MSIVWFCEYENNNDTEPVVSSDLVVYYGIPRIFIYNTNDVFIISAGTSVFCCSQTVGCETRYKRLLHF